MTSFRYTETARSGDGESMGTLIEMLATKRKPAEPSAADGPTSLRVFREEHEGQGGDGCGCGGDEGSCCGG